MITRTISRLATTGLVAGALIAAAARPALATPSREDCACGGARMPAGASARPSVPSANVTAGTNVAAPDQQNPIPPPEKAVVPSPPNWPVNPQVLTPPQPVAASPDSGFQWDDAGIGAGGALAIVLTALGGVAIVRRRGGSDGPLPA